MAIGTFREWLRESELNESKYGGLDPRVASHKLIGEIEKYFNKGADYHKKFEYYLYNFLDIELDSRGRIKDSFIDVMNEFSPSDLPKFLEWLKKLK